MGAEYHQIARAFDALGPRGFEGVDVAAGHDADRSGEDIERGARERLKAVRAWVGVAAARFDLQARGGQLKTHPMPSSMLGFE